MFGATLANPIVMAPYLCIPPDDHLSRSLLIGTIFFCSGLATLLQSTFGVRSVAVQLGVTSQLSITCDVTKSVCI